MIEAVVLKPVALEPDAINDIDDNFKHIVNDIVIDINGYYVNVSNTWSLQNMRLAELGFGVTVLQTLLNFSGMAPLMLLPVGYLKF